LNLVTIKYNKQHFLIPKNSDVFLFIGIKLWKGLSNEVNEISIFTVVEVLSRVINDVHDPEVRTEMVQLFYAASQKNEEVVRLRESR